MNGLEKTASHISRKGINLSDARPLPYGEMLALFDGISREDNEELSDMWARLIAETMTESESEAISTRAVASILSQMSPEAAKSFRLLAKEARVKIASERLNRLFSQEFFPLSEEEKHLDEKTLKVELDLISDQVRDEWSSIGNSGEQAEKRLEVAKIELLRLNLIERQDTNVYFRNAPFSNGYKITESALDQIISDLQDRLQELIDTRTAMSKHPFFNRHNPTYGSNFQLSAAGTEIAKRLALI